MSRTVEHSLAAYSRALTSDLVAAGRRLKLNASYFVRSGGTVRGPLSLKELQDAVRQKAIVISDEIASSAEGPWNRVATVYRDVIDGRAPRLLSDRKAEMPRRPSSPASLTKEDRRPPDEIEFAEADAESDVDDPGSLNEVVQQVRSSPPLPPILKAPSGEARLPPPARGPQSVRTYPRLALMIWPAAFVSVLALVVILSSSKTPQSGESAAESSATGSSSGSGSAETAGTTTPSESGIGSAVDKGLTKLQRTLGMNKAEQERLQASILSIELELKTGEITSRTVFQQQVTRIDACIAMTAIVAQALGAKPTETEAIVSQRTNKDILADTVFQQLAGHLTLYFQMTALAAKNAGAPSDDIANCTQQLELADLSATTAQQQIAARIDGIQEMSRLLAKTLGAPEDRLTAVSTTTLLNDTLSDTVFQQMSARQDGVLRFLAEAARAQGAEPAMVDEILAESKQDDILVDTVQQQYAARINRSFAMTSLLAESIVKK